jgi:TolA-binding protein
VEDLLARARGGSLSDAEARALADTLAGSLEDRLLYQVGCALDAEPDLMPDDALRLERMVQIARRRVAPRASRLSRPKSVALAVAAGMLLGAGVVSAFQISMRWFSHRAEVVHAPHAPSALANGSTPNSEQPASAVAPSESAWAVDSAPILASASPIVGAAPVRASTARATEPESGEPAAPTPSVSAADLFARASGARVRGDETGAIALYRQLEALYPESTETATARQALGMLYLQRDRPELALHEFAAARATTASLARADSLWGEALALAKLGRNAEERSTLAALLAEYPTSAYAEAVRKRLTLLDSGAR